MAQSRGSFTGTTYYCGTTMGRNVCCLCVLWGAGRVILYIFEVAPEFLDIPLSVLARRSHKELCPRKPTRPEEKDDESQSVVRL